MDAAAIFEWVYREGNAWLNRLALVVETLPVSYAFGAGMLSTLNPCGFIMLPAFASFYLNADGPQPADRPRTGQRLVRALVMGTLVAVAFAATFGAAGLAITAVGSAFMRWAGWGGLLVGLALVALGAVQLVTRRSLLAGVTAGVRVKRSRSVPGVLMFGVGYAVCSLSCTLPIFLVVAGGVFLGGRSFADSMTGFVEYAAGMGAVFIVITLGVAVLREQTTRAVGLVLPYVEAVGNVALIFAGSYIVWYWLVPGDLL